MLLKEPAPCTGLHYVAAERPPILFLSPWCTSQPFNRKAYRYRHLFMYMYLIQRWQQWNHSGHQRLNSECCTSGCNPWYIRTRCFVIGPNETCRQISCFLVGPTVPIYFACSVGVTYIWRLHEIQTFPYTVPRWSRLGSFNHTPSIEEYFNLVRPVIDPPSTHPA